LDNQIPHAAPPQYVICQ